MSSTVSSAKLDASGCETLFQVKVKLRRGQLPELKSVEMLTQGVAVVTLPGGEKISYQLPKAFDDGFIESLAKHKCLIEWSSWLANQASIALNGLPRDINLAVNVDPIELKQMGFALGLEEKIQEADRQRVFLEITEQSQLDNSTATYQVIRGLVDAGFKLSIDDFCKVPKIECGYITVDAVTHSHIHYLGTLPVSELKIDMTCAELITTSLDHPIAGVVRWMCALPDHREDIKVVMEGISEKFPIEFLDEYLDSDKVLFQGFAFSKKITLETLNTKLKPGNAWAA